MRHSRQRRGCKGRFRSDRAFAGRAAADAGRVQHPGDRGRGDGGFPAVLLEAGANVHARDVVGSTPLHSVASGRALHRTSNAHTTDAAQRYSETAELLLANGADVNAIHANQSTPLHSAAVFCDRAVAEVLIAHGADINATSHNGETPLKAAQRGFSSIKSMSARMPSDDVAERTACFEWIIPWLEGQGAEE
ncbi:MAG: ankyrin repeat domain-containing protein [Planctomycetes bacterium]|nr:ankyrin repeat domain-containing protein [Planctomycetota bacterium]